MKDPLVLIITRLLFTAYFVFIFVVLYSGWYRQTDLSFSWLVYLLFLYAFMEHLYSVFRRRGIDLAFAFPLLFAIFLIHLVSMYYQAQEKFPLLNRAEHFTSFIFITYIAWTFFIHYLPQNVWREHPYYTSLIVLSVTAFAGVSNEIIELGLDALAGTALVGDRYDTSLDVLMNTLGSGLFLAVRLILGEKTRGYTG